MNPYLISSESPQDLPILIIDKHGIIGTSLAGKLSGEFLTIFVHGSEAISGKNIIHTPYRKHLSVIPENIFSYIFIISEDEKELYSQLNAIAKAPSEEDAEIVVIIPATLSKDRVIKKIFSNLPKATIAVVGDVFGAGSPASFLDVQIHRALDYGQLIISTNGREKSYPIYIEDVVAGIIRCVFAEKHQGEVFLVMPKYLTSDTSLVRMIQKELPDVKVIQKRRIRKQSQYFIPQRAIYVFEPYDIEKGIKALIHHRPLSSILHSPVTFTPSRLLVLQQRIKTFILLTSVSLAGLFLVIAVGYVSTLGMKKLSPASAFSRSPAGIAISSWLFLLGKQAVADLSPLSELVGFSALTDHMENQLDSSYQLTLLARDIAKVKTLIVGLKNNESAETLNALVVITKNIHVRAQTLQLQGIQSRNTSEVGALTTMNALGLPFIDLLPQLAGQKTVRTYLVLLQNNHSIRSGGGTVNWYGLLTLQNGKIKNFSVQDVKTLDPQATEQVTVPEYLKKYNGLKQLTLHDSMYSVDVPEAFKQANLIYYLESNKRIDGIVSLDLKFLESFMNISGSMQISSQKITKENVSTALLSNPAKANDIFIALQKNFVNYMYDNPQIMGEFISEMISQRHMQLYSEEPGVENAILANNMSATIAERRSREEGSYNDFSYISEAGIDASNSAQTINKSIEHKITFTDGGDEESMLNVTYDNTAPGSQDYGMYVQVALPKGAKITGITLDGVGQILSATAPVLTKTKRAAKVVPTLALDQMSQAERMVFGFFVTIPAQQKMDVALTYTIPQVVQFSNKTFTYKYLFAKQPGSPVYPLDVAIDYPTTMRISAKQANLEAQDHQVLFSDKLLKDQQFTVSFSPL